MRSSNAGFVLEQVGFKTGHQGTAVFRSCSQLFRATYLQRNIYFEAAFFGRKSVPTEVRPQMDSASVPSKSRLRTIIADDIPACLQMTQELLKDRCEIVATACNGFDALDAILRFQPDLAILDINMPGLNGLNVAEQAIREQPKLWVLLCTFHREQALIEAAATAGARGYVCKMNLYSDLLPAIEAISAGQVFFPALE